MNASTIDSLLGQLADLLGPLSPFTKAVVPGALALAVAVVNSIINGIDQTSLLIAGTGLVAALVAYFVPNRPKKLPVVPPPVVPVKK